MLFDFDLPQLTQSGFEDDEAPTEQVAPDTELDEQDKRQYRKVSSVERAWTQSKKRELCIRKCKTRAEELMTLSEINDFSYLFDDEEFSNHFFSLFDEHSTGCLDQQDFMDKMKINTKYVLNISFMYLSNWYFLTQWSNLRSYEQHTTYRSHPHDRECHVHHLQRQPYQCKSFEQFTVGNIGNFWL